MIDQQLGTVVIGGSQAGLAVGYFLKTRGLPFVIVDENARIGDAWRKRWDSLRLFTPGRYNGLPGMPFPGQPWAYPTKDETADYLEAYARAFELPVRTGVRVDRLSKTGDRFEVTCGQHALFAEKVVVATGAFNNPRVPSFARDLDASIVQLHSKEYRYPSQIQKGAVLVVLHRASVPLLAEFGAGGRCGAGCRAHRRPHRFHATVKKRRRCGRSDTRWEAVCVTGSCPY
jgi:putative flavoprotein involved in K+ transport